MISARCTLAVNRALAKERTANVVANPTAVTRAFKTRILHTHDVLRGTLWGENEQWWGHVPMGYGYPVDNLITACRRERGADSGTN